MDIGIKEAKRIWKYRNQWVALVKGQVVAHGDSLKEVNAEVKEKKLKNYVFHFVSSLPSTGYAVQK